VVDLGRTLHVQGFVRTLVIEDLDKFVEAGLLLQEVGGFFLRDEMHTLMTTVLLRRTWLDPFDADPQTEPPEPRAC
jgi:hypothetical protein